MKESDLRHLRRADLLALLEEVSRQNDSLRKELDEANARLAQQEVRISRCGSLAEAALELSGVYEAADKAAEEYLRLVRENVGAGADNPTCANVPTSSAAPDGDPHTGADTLGRHFGGGGR